MGLKRNLEHKLQQAVVDKVTEKVMPGGAEGAINSVVTKLGKLTGQKTAQEYVKKAEKHILIVKEKSISLKTITNTFKRIAKGRLPDIDEDLGQYLVVDTSGGLKYRTDAEDDILDRTITNVYDSEGNRIGYIQEHLNTMGIPLLEKDVKRCSVFLNSGKICTIKKSESFGSTDIEVTDGDFRIWKNSLCTNIEIKSRDSKAIIGELESVPFTLKNGYADKFVLEYKDPEKEVIAVLLAIAVDSIIV